VLLLIPALAILRATVLGFGTADLVGHLLLDLLVIGVFFPLLSNRVMAQPWEPTYYTIAALCLSIYMGWLYLPSGVGLALFLFLLTVAVCAVMRVVRLHLWTVTFVRGDRVLDPLHMGPTPGEERSRGAADIGTWGTRTSWTRFLALPLLFGLLLSYVAIRVARPMDKRAAAEPILEKNNPVMIAREFLKAAVNGNAPLFAREHAIWYVAPAERRPVMAQAAVLFASFHEELQRLSLTWVDLSTATTAGVTGADPKEEGTGRVVYELGRNVHAWLEDPEAVPEGARSTGRPGYGEILLWSSPVRIELRQLADGAWRVVRVGDSIAFALAPPAR